MKTYRILLLTVLFTVMSGLLLATPVSKEYALNKAKQFFTENVQNGLRSGTAFQLVYSDTGRVLNNSADAEFVNFYVFNVGNKDGFVIISGDDAVKPILAYSDEGSFPTENIPENVKNWLDYYSREIQYVVANSSSQTPKNPTVETTANLRATNASVPPLLGGISWDQGDPYNLLCPHSTKDSKSTYTGCTATAMAQIMRYHRWPITGTGTKSYFFLLDSVSTTLSANFGKTTYDWDNMLDNYGGSSTAVQDSAVALLMYHCGISANMKYGTSSSSASLANAGIALKTYFGYDADLQYYKRENFSLTSWTAKLVNELDAGRPIFYAGSSDTAGHAFVCDGYDNNGLFHFNWGWGGSSNGYFLVSILDPDFAGIGSSSGGYSQGQYAVMGIQKPDGISNPSYSMSIYNKGLTSTKSSLANINSETFDASVGFINWGLNSFSGYVTVGLYKDGVFQKNLSNKYTITDLGSGYGTQSIPFSNVSLIGLAAGNYQLYLVYQPSGSSTWSQVVSTQSLNNYLNITISGTTATITKPSLKPELVLTSSIQTEGKIYQNRTGRFNISVKNNGNEYYSYLSLYIYSASNPSVNRYLNKGLAVIRNGETVSVQLSGDITLAPGTYKAIAVYDSTNNFSATNYKNVAPSSFTPLEFTIYNEPVKAVLTLNSIISIEGGNTFYVNQDIKLNADITNTGGFFDDEIIAFIFRSSGGYSVGYLNPQTIYIDSLETKTYTLTGSFNLDPGNYIITLRYNQSGWKSFTPTLNQQIHVTIQTPPVVGLADPVIKNEDIQIYPNPVKDIVNIKFSQKPEDGTLITVYNILGKVILKSKADNKEISLDLVGNPAGSYFIKISQEVPKTYKIILE